MWRYIDSGISRKEGMARHQKGGNPDVLMSIDSGVVHFSQESFKSGNQEIVSKCKFQDLTLVMQPLFHLNNALFTLTLF